MFSLGELSLALRCWTQHWKCIFAIISPIKRAGPFSCTNSNPLFSRMRCTKFIWNWPSGSTEEDFLNFVYAISLLSFLEKRRGPIFEQTWTQGCFVPSGWIGPVVLVKKIKMWKFKTDERTTGDQKTSLEVSSQTS